MARLILLRGFSASGKTTVAKQWLAEDPDNRVRINRDDLRSSLFNQEGILSTDKEALITKVQRQVATDALKAGKDVINDDTNLRRKFAVEWADLAMKCGADFEVIDRHVPLEICLENNRRRAEYGGRFVPEEAIRNQARRFPFPWPKIEPKNSHITVESYDRVTGHPTYLVDIDGTVADMGDRRGPFDWNLVHLDEARQDVLRLVGVLSKSADIVFLSGRDGSCRDKTIEWLDSHVNFEYELYMREADDMRPDYVVKYELFNEHARHRNIVGVIDDRPQVTLLWRQLGLTVFDVGDGTIF